MLAGAIPGLTATMAVALFLPLAFASTPATPSPPWRLSRRLRRAPAGASTGGLDEAHVAPDPGA